jgi:methylated-DNA-[protein]-cysteine S-methyltransferase
MATKDKLKIMQRLLLQIPHGRVTTYKELARAMGTKGYRFIGQLLHQNPKPDRFPCYKVVRSDGSLGGFAKGQKDKIRRLRKEGISVKSGMIVSFEKRIFRFG